MASNLRTTSISASSKLSSMGVPSKGGVNIISSKVTTLLSTSFADSNFREALALLDARGVQNTPETRRRLRLDIQKEIIESNSEIIDEFGKVAEQLRRVGLVMQNLNGTYSEMKARLAGAHAATSEVLKDASFLMAEKRQVETKQNLLKAFKANFLLSEKEVALLTLASEPVNDHFFTVVTKAKKICKECEVLLGFENQTLGLDIMGQTSKNLNLGYQKLYRWIQREFKTLNLENPQIGSAIRRALRFLAERPTLFQNCLDFFAEAREHILSDAFYTALNGSSRTEIKQSSVKPIELVAHDPLRYVGDMLAWAHSTAVGEREALEVLFVLEGDEIAKGIQEGRENELWRLIDEEDHEIPPFSAVQAINELVDRDMSGAARILRQRVEQVIKTNEETILAYKLANLLDFYGATFAKLLTRESSLVEILSSLESEALRQFCSLMRDHITNLQDKFQHIPVDLSAPDFLQDALEQLTSIMNTYNTSLSSSADREADFQPILTEALDSFMAGCENMAITIDAPDSSIFMINCLLAANAVLLQFDFALKRSKKIEESITKESVKLMESQYLFFQVESGLKALMTALAPLENKKEDIEKVLSLQETQSLALSQASQTLDNFLPSALMDAMENIKNLQDSKLAGQITEEAAEKFCVDFEHVEEMLILADELAEQNSEGDETEISTLRSLFPRTSADIRVLLS